MKSVAAKVIASSGTIVREKNGYAASSDRLGLVAEKDIAGM
jgi:hypothetical protein